VGEKGGFAGDGLEVGHGRRTGGLDAVIVDGVFVHVVVEDGAREVGEAVDVGGPEGGERAVGDGLDEGGGAAAQLAGRVAVDAGAAKEDVRAANDLEPEAAAGAFARGVGAGGVVGEDERRQDLALLTLAGGELLAVEAARDATHVVEGDGEGTSEVDGRGEGGDGEVEVGVSGVGGRREDGWFWRSARGVGRGGGRLSM
jgi:hypothetical protein